MYSLVIAAADSRLRNDLRCRVEWELLGFERILLLSDGREVLMALKEAPDVVIMDEAAAFTDAAAIFGEIRKNGRRTRVIVLCSPENVNIACEAVKLGAVGYILPPFEGSAVLKLVDEAIAGIEEESSKTGKLAALEKLAKEAGISFEFGDKEIAQLKTRSYFKEVRGAAGGDIPAAKSFSLGFLLQIHQYLYIKAGIDIFHRENALKDIFEKINACETIDRLEEETATEIIELCRSYPVKL